MEELIEIKTGKKTIKVPKDDYFKAMARFFQQNDYTDFQLTADEKLILHITPIRHNLEGIKL